MQKIKQGVPQRSRKVAGEGFGWPRTAHPRSITGADQDGRRQFALRVGPLATEGHGSVHKICYFTVSTICVDADGVPATELVAVTVMV